MRPKRAAPASVLLLAALGAAACASTSRPAPSLSRVYSFGVVGSVTKLMALEHRTPALVSGIPGKVVEIATSNSDSYALTSTGTVWAWGAGAYGELGNGTSPQFARTPVKVDFPAGVRISSLPNPMPFDAGLAIDSRGGLWGWGNDEAHELCLSSTQSLLRPRRLVLRGVTLATGAGGHALFDSGGTVYGCGEGMDGELGDGSTRARSVPTAVVGLPPGPVTALVSSWQGSGALMADGSYYDWGFDAAGQLGDGKTTNSSVPVRVDLPAAVTQVSQGGSLESNGQTLVILANGSVWAWGNGRRGELGNGGTANSSVPIEVGFPTGVRITQVNSGGSTCYALSSTGELWAWGRNQYGQLGNGSSVAAQLTPVPVGITLTQISSTSTNVAGFYQP